MGDPHPGEVPLALGDVDVHIRGCSQYTHIAEGGHSIGALLADPQIIFGIHVNLRPSENDVCFDQCIELKGITWPEEHGEDLCVPADREVDMEGGMTSLSEWNERSVISGVHHHGLHCDGQRSVDVNISKTRRRGDLQLSSGWMD